MQLFIVSQMITGNAMHGIEDFPKHPVPLEAKKSLLTVAATSAAWVIAVTTLFTGGSLAQSMPIEQTILAIFAGMAVVAVVGFALAYLGSELGVSTTILAHRTFGRWGAAILGLVLAITLGVGWFAWQISFFAITLHEMLPDWRITDPEFSMVWAGALMTLTALGGFRWLSRLSLVAVPAILLVAGYGMYVALKNTTQSDISETAVSTMTFTSALTAVVGSVIFGAIVLADISRFSRDRTTGALLVVGGYVIGGTIVMIAGAVMVSATDVPGIGSTANIPAVMAALGLGSAAFAVLLLAQWSTNDSNLYSGSLGLAAVLPLPKPVLILSMGLAGIVIASLGIQDQFVPFLILLGTFMPPVAGVIVADYFLVNRHQFNQHFKAGEPIANINLTAVSTSVLSGIAASLLSTTDSILSATSISGFLIALITYAVIGKTVPEFIKHWPFGDTTLD